MPKCRAAACLLLPLAAAGCHLVDQRDFDRTAGARPVPKAVAAPAPAAPSLVTIRYTTPDPAYRDALAQAVRQALSRKADVLFTVTTLVPAPAGPDAQAEAASKAAESGREVAQAIVDSGAAAGQIEQVVQIVPGATIREVRVQVH